MENFDFAQNLVEELHINYKQFFILPNFYEIDDFANEHASKVIKEKYRNNSPTIFWNDGMTYEIYFKDIL